MTKFWRRFFGPKAASQERSKAESIEPRVVQSDDHSSPRPRAKPIYRRLLELGENDSADFELGGESLERDYNWPEGLAFMPGALDGITMRHMASATPAEIQAFKAALEPLFRKSLAVVDDQKSLVEALSDLQEFLARQPMAKFADAAVHTVVDLRPSLKAMQLIGKSLVIGTLDREVAKFGLTTLMIAPDQDTMYLLRLFGRHEEFAPYVIAALSSCADDPAAEVWELGKRFTGWGRVHAVTFLATQSEGRPELSRWLLCEGWRAGLTESLPFDCAVGGRLREVLCRTPDEDELDGCCSVIAALTGEDALPPMDELPSAAECIELLVRSLHARCDSLDRGCAILELHGWLSRETDQGANQLFAKHRLREIVGECENLLASMPVPALVEETIACRRADEIWKASRLADWAKFDWWEGGFAWLRSQPDCGVLVSELVQTDDKRRGERLLEFLEENGVLETPKNFAKSELPTSFEFAISQYLDLLIRCNLRSDLVQSIAARSGWLPNRRKLVEWLLNVRPDELGPRTVAALRRNAVEETDGSLRTIFGSLVAKVDALLA